MKREEKQELPVKPDRNPKKHVTDKPMDFSFSF